MPQNDSQPDSDAPFAWKHESEYGSCFITCRDGNLYMLPGVETQDIKWIFQHIMVDKRHPELIQEPKPFTKIPLDRITEFRVYHDGPIIEATWISETKTIENEKCEVNFLSDGHQVAQAVLKGSANGLEHHTEEAKYLEETGWMLYCWCLPYCVVGPLYMSEVISLAVLQYGSGAYVLLVIAYTIYRIFHPYQIDVWGEAV